MQRTPRRRFDRLLGLLPNDQRRQPLDSAVSKGLCVDNFATILSADMGIVPSLKTYMKWIFWVFAVSKGLCVGGFVIILSADVGMVLCLKLI